ncbi:hypothetical protein [Salinirubrum litoreum]|uniref:Sec-independent protein translocase protein TatA n=1 Tax=Salinirubrum litoreum TaxID=1126234 RepID=A0ABD5RFP1_9EURY|nr:hypothetical protein [Salinirubrum litoreum]
MFDTVSPVDRLAFLVVVGLAILTEQLLLGVVAVLLLRIAVALNGIRDALRRDERVTEQ